MTKPFLARQWSSNVVVEVKLNGNQKKPESKVKRLLTNVDRYELLVYHKLSVPLTIALILAFDFLDDGMINASLIGSFID